MRSNNVYNIITVTYGNEIVGWIHVRISIIYNERSHVQSTDWKFDESVDFLSAVAGVGKYLQMDYHYIGHIPKINFLGCTLTFLARWTIPTLILC